MPLSEHEKDRLAICESGIFKAANVLALLPPEEFEIAQSEFLKLSPFDSQITGLVIQIARNWRTQSSMGN